ncbi:hypothetical protein TNCV_3677841 [Trichonephila clavipes]|nr:hypothetical protein TNCV_3677841 [Trichonephila clavipes]
MDDGVINYSVHLQSSAVKTLRKCILLMLVPDACSNLTNSLPSRMASVGAAEVIFWILVCDTNYATLFCSIFYVIYTFDTISNQQILAGLAGTRRGWMKNNSNLH